MSLLMIRPTDASPAAESIESVSAGKAVLVRARRGQFFGTELLEPGHAAHLFAFIEDDPVEFLSPHHSRVFNGSFLVRIGMRMTTNRRRPLFVIGRDSSGAHDLLLPASAACRDSVSACLAGAGLHMPRVPDPVNLFSGVELDEDGSIRRLEPSAVMGGMLMGRVLLDSVFVVAVTGVLPSRSGAAVPEASSMRVMVTNTPQG